MKKITNYEDLKDFCLSSALEIKELLCRGKDLEAGVELGQLIETLRDGGHLCDKCGDEIEEYDDETVEDEFAEAEGEAAYQAILNDELENYVPFRVAFYEQGKVLSELEIQHNDLKKLSNNNFIRFRELENLFKHLIAIDHIHKNSLIEVAETLKKDTETVEDILSLNPAYVRM